MTVPWAQVRALFERALDVAPAARAAWLQRETGGDRELAAAVERLLAHDAPPGFLSPPGARMSPGVSQKARMWSGDCASMSVKLRCSHCPKCISRKSGSWGRRTRSRVSAVVMARLRSEEMTGASGGRMRGGG